MTTLLLFAIEAHAGSPELDTCLNNAQNQLDMTGCAWEEYERQDKRLNVNYAAAMAKRDDAGKAALRAEQRAWITRRDASCPAPGKESGSMGPMEHNLCLAGATQSRADVLEGMAR